MIVNEETIFEQAERLWKDNEVMKQKWLAAVATARGSKRGWILDKMIERRDKE